MIGKKYIKIYGSGGEEFKVKFSGYKVVKL